MPSPPRFSSVIPITLSLTGLISLMAAPLPASAYQVYLNGRQGGNPVSNLHNLTLDSNYDVGRTLDPTTWYVPAGTSNGREITPIPLSATLQTVVKAFDSQKLTLGLTIKNTTTLPSSNYIANILSFGFGITPNVTSVSLSQSENAVFDNAIVQTSKQQKFPGGFKQIDICIFSDGCSGGDVKTGLQAGQSDSFDLNIAGDFWDSSKGTNFVTLSDFPLKFQTTNGSFEPAGVPEPTTIIGTALALGFGVMSRKKLIKKQARTVSK
ncbi:cistern family PEP-CTERM protein [Lyngbya confervoides]|uniref:Cistern family PEP-CTERM protein n=1 Tax=Lyngbya confervoides BDU141951 TaxID=1574623 RepID=A0ABD4T8X2_9CYAN|nr:cistern family PEP-CTERM protein [Lyngbya confervoides]MCM1984893.1 cistern family PEP-CTERM protein [Lyngbya confervoides BDU141951]